MNNSYYELKNKLYDLNQEEVHDYIEDFLSEVNFKSYYKDEDITEDSLKALEVLFSEGELNEKIEEALDIDELCIEALLCSGYLLDDVIVYQRLEKAKNNIIYFDDLLPYKKHELIEAYDLYADFLASISNIKGAIALREEILNYKERDYYDIAKLAMLYTFVEDGDKLLKLLDYPQEDAYVYLMCIVTLLKENREAEAESVLKDLISDFKEAEYIDHIWDLKEDINTKDFIHSVEESFDTLCSIPYFFSWCRLHKSNNIAS